MGTANLAPHDAELGVLHLFLGLVHVSNPLSDVELRVLLCSHPVNLQERAVGVAVGLAALVAQNQALRVKAHWLLGLPDKLRLRLGLGFCCLRHGYAQLLVLWASRWSQTCKMTLRIMSSSRDMCIFTCSAQRCVQKSIQHPTQLL